jgi:hypothetical protein
LTERSTVYISFPVFFSQIFFYAFSESYESHHMCWRTLLMFYTQIKCCKQKGGYYLNPGGFPFRKHYVNPVEKGTIRRAGYGSHPLM